MRNLRHRNVSLTKVTQLSVELVFRHRESGLRVSASYSALSQFIQSCPTLCNPMDCSTPGFPVHHQLLEPAQTRVHQVGDAIQPSHPLLSPSPAAFCLSQHQGFFQWVSSLHHVAKYWSFSFNISPSNEYSGLIPLALTGWITLQSKGLSRVFSNTTVQKHQFFSTQLSL